MRVTRIRVTRTENTSDASKPPRSASARTSWQQCRVQGAVRTVVLGGHHASTRTSTSAESSTRLGASGSRADDPLREPSSFLAASYVRSQP